MVAVNDSKKCVHFRWPRDLDLYPNYLAFGSLVSEIVMSECPEGYKV